MDMVTKRVFRTVLLFALSYSTVQAQNIPLPENLPQGHPRLLCSPEYRPELQKQIQNEDWAKEVLQGILNRIDPYVEKTQKEPDWMYSRLMMYWKSKASNVYIRGGYYSHADGEAPVPTVRFGSTRGVSSPFKSPSIEDIIPYMDDTKGVYFRNTAKEGNPLEWTEQSNISGSNIEGVNAQIIGLAKDAAFVAWLNNDDTYGRFAFDIFDTYMMGMYYRNEPIDLENGHAQTLAGLSTFEVIQERILTELSYLYDFLYEYIRSKHNDRIDKYEATFKKWIDLTIKNGVPQNNWNLHQAGLIQRVAMILEDNRNYADGKGREYYIDYILNQTSTRQWSLLKLMEYGYDFNTGVWNECPGYSIGVTGSFVSFIRNYDNIFNQNLLPYTPVMATAVKMLPQYMFPNAKISAFGDTHYGDLNTQSFRDMIQLSQKYNDRKNEELFTKMYKLFDRNAGRRESTRRFPSQISSFFTAKPLVLDEKIEKGKLKDYVTQTFYAPNVSWFVQRNGYENRETGLMISQYASYGNHAHSNGVAIELYGKGYILGAESGVGSSYFEKPYLEYYSQFPAHNTVMVDGISKYPEMLSNHPFDLLSCYPQPSQINGYYPDITFSEVYFLEPESRSDQNRTLSIVRTSETTGYYVDIFRSKKQRQGDRFHDYFYHNIGQELFIRDASGNPLNLQASEEITFAGGRLFSLDYLWNKQSVKTDKDYQAVWKMAMPDGNHVYMNLWMKGYENREVFSANSPACKAFRGEHGIPYNIDGKPFLTLVARQHGEAWNRPFVSIFEPTTEKEGKSIQSIEAFEPDKVSPDFVGLIVKHKSGKQDCIFSSVKDENVKYNDMTVNASYAIVSETGSDFAVFMGNGTTIMAKGFTITSNHRTSAVLEYKNGEYYFTCEAPVVITNSKGKSVKFDQTSYSKIDYK